MATSSIHEAVRGGRSIAFLALPKIFEYCYAARSTFAKLKVIATCTYSNFFAQGLKTRSSTVLWKTADHHGTIECMIDVLGNLHNQMKLASTSLLLLITDCFFVTRFIP